MGKVGVVNPWLVMSVKEELSVICSTQGSLSGRGVVLSSTCVNTEGWGK